MPTGGLNKSMCGIAGMVKSDAGGLVEASDVRRMCNMIIHRGPDEEGVLAQGPVGLGSRRLSIIDLSTGQQPVHNEDKSVWVVFNGEIYNFPLLRSELQARGHSFYTHSDTEVIVHLYEEYGSDCVRHLRGMFGFALWDNRNQRLLLARDRFGKKPLHYALKDGRLLFGSEIKSLLAVAPELQEIDPQGLQSYFCFGYIPDPQTAFKVIRKLPAGHVLEFSNGNLHLRSYWDLPKFGMGQIRSEQEALEQLEAHLREAVRIRLISDVPLGALLSGGVDSSVVVALMAQLSSAPVKTFSIGFRNQQFNEAEHARLVAQTFGTEHHEFVVEPDFSATLLTLSHQLEEPFGDASMLPTYAVCQMARQHVTVALAGDGGDEVFAGYDRYSVNLRRQRLKFIPAWAGRLYRKHLFPRLPGTVYGRRYLYTMSLPPNERYLSYISVLDTGGPEANVFTQEFLSLCRSLPSPLDSLRACLKKAPASDDLSRLQYLDMKSYLPGDILPKVDRMSMANSLEVRAPLLDHVVAEWACQLPSHLKIQKGEQKYLLKKLAEQLGVPRSVLYRRKQGFAIPLEQWFRGKWKDELLGILLEPTTFQRGYFDARAIRQLMSEHSRGRRDRSRELWLLLVFELWHRNFVGNIAKRPNHDQDTLVVPKRDAGAPGVSGTWGSRHQNQSTGKLSSV
jgi:asparagine synthase (glutamine-hydrolysing)